MNKLKSIYIHFPQTGQNIITFMLSLIHQRAALITLSELMDTEAAEVRTSHSHITRKSLNIHRDSSESTEERGTDLELFGATLLHIKQLYFQRQFVYKEKVDKRLS